MPPPVAVRLPQELRQELEALASAERSKLSTVVRRLLAERLTASASREVEEAGDLQGLADDLQLVARIQAEHGIALERLRSQIAKGFLAVLGQAIKDKERLKDWVNSTFSPLFGVEE